MSEIKYININDDRFWQILFDEACVEGKQAERIQNELEQIAVDEKEIIRKPMQEIVERLEEFKTDFIGERFYEKHCEKIVDEQACVGRNCFDCSLSKAIEIVKEVGGMNEEAD